MEKRGELQRFRVQRFKVQGFKVQGSRVQRLNKTKRFNRLNRVPLGKFNGVNSEPSNAHGTGFVNKILNLIR